MWRVSAQISGDAGVLVLLSGFCHSQERLVVCSFRVIESESTRAATLWPEVAKGPGHWNTFKKRIHARIPKPGRTISSITPEWLIHKIGTDKIAAQAARSWMGTIISSVTWDPKEHHFPSGCSRIEVAGIWMHKCKCEVSRMDLLKIQRHTEVVRWKNKVKMWGNHLGYSKAEAILWSQKWEADQLLKARSYVLTWAIQETDKISEKHVLHLRCLTHGTPAKRKGHLTCRTAELVWWKSMENCWERNRMVC